MQESLFQLASEDIVAIVSIVFTFVTGMVVWLSLQWRWNRRAELEVGLKRDMLDRGMSAEEIDRVIRAPLGEGATLPRSAGCQNRRSAAPLDAIRARS